MEFLQVNAGHSHPRRDRRADDSGPVSLSLENEPKVTYECLFTLVSFVVMLVTPWANRCSSAMCRRRSCGRRRLQPRVVGRPSRRSSPRRSPGRSGLKSSPTIEATIFRATSHGIGRTCPSYCGGTEVSLWRSSMPLLSITGVISTRWRRVCSLGLEAETFTCPASRPVATWHGSDRPGDARRDACTCAPANRPSMVVGD
jgi:hypothetical protein